MGWWSFRERRGHEPGEPPDYYREGLKLANQRKYHEALTSFRLALRKRPDDPEIMQQMAVVYTHIGMPDEAIRFYREAIQHDVDASAAHYGLAFLLLRQGDEAGARAHLGSFLENPPGADDAEAHIEHARRTLERLKSGSPEGEPAGEEPEPGQGGGGDLE